MRDPEEVAEEFWFWVRSTTLDTLIVVLALVALVIVWPMKGWQGVVVTWVVSWFLFDRLALLRGSLRNALKAHRSLRRSL